MRDVIIKRANEQFQSPRFRFMLLVALAVVLLVVIICLAVFLAEDEPKQVKHEDVILKDQYEQDLEQS